MRIQENQNTNLNFGLGIKKTRGFRKALKSQSPAIREAINAEINALRKEYALISGGCKLEKRFIEGKPVFMIRGEEGTVYSSTTEHFSLKPGAIKEALKGWWVDYMDLRTVHDPQTRTMVDAFGLDPEFKRLLSERKTQKMTRVINA